VELPSRVRELIALSLIWLAQVSSEIISDKSGDTDNSFKGRAFIFDGVVGVSVSAMTLKRGSASGYGGSSLLTGGCAMVVNADVNITDVKFDACRANGNSNNAPAGAIYVDRVSKGGDIYTPFYSSCSNNNKIQKKTYNNLIFTYIIRKVL
jgi:hypothetical protein